MATQGNTVKRPVEASIPTKGGILELPLVDEKGSQKLLLRSVLGFTRPQFARLTNVSERTIAGVESGERAVEKLVRIYRETDRLVQALNELFGEKSVGPWLLAENDAFDGWKPLELIERGQVDVLWGMVYRLRNGVPM